MVMTDAQTAKPLPTSSTPSPTLDDLAKGINDDLSHMASSFRNSVRHAIEAGKKLEQAKDRVAHGNYESWLKDHCRLSYRTARRYMNLAKHQKEIEAKLATVADLNLADAYRLIGETAKSNNAVATDTKANREQSAPAGDEPRSKHKPSSKQLFKQLEAFKEKWEDFNGWQRRAFVKKYQHEIEELLEEVEKEVAHL